MKKIFISILLSLFIFSSLFSTAFSKELFEKYIGKRVIILLKSYRNQRNDDTGSFSEGMFIKEVYDDYIVCSDFKKSGNYYYILIDEIASFFVFKADENDGF